MTRRPESRELSTAGPAASPQGITRLRSELERLFDRFFGPEWGSFSGLGRGMLSALPSPQSGWMPSVDVTDSEREFTVRAELPGLDAKDIDVSVSGNRLVLSGEKKEEHEEKGKAFFRSERRYGTFRRAIPLPAGADPDRIRAEYDQGVLVVHVEKSEAVRPKRIEVSSPGTKTKQP